MSGKRKRATGDAQGPDLEGQKRARSDNLRTTFRNAAKSGFQVAPFVEAPTGDDRRREADLYELLGSADDDERIKAADCIVSSLLAEDGVTEAVLRRHLDRRLFRGLASGRKASRIGFSLVITELLSQLYGKNSQLSARYPGLTFDTVLGLLVDKTQAVGNKPGQEERDHYFGQLFGLECFVQSKVLLVDSSRWNSVLELILKLGNKKIWLRPQSGWIIVQALQQMNRKEAETTLSQLSKAGLAKTAEGVAAWIVALDRYPDLKIEPWHSPLSPNSLGELAAILKESFKDTPPESGGSSQAGGKSASWNPQLHFAWDIILGWYAKGGSEADVESFNRFWSRVVDDGLFSRNATDGQKFKGFMVLQKMLEGLVEQPPKLHCLFSKNLMVCWINQASKEDRYLHRAAIKALKTIENVASSHPQALIPILQGLLGKNGSYNFDQRTGTKTVGKLLQTAEPESARGVLAVIKQPISTLHQDDPKASQALIRTYADYLSKILKSLARDTPGGSLPAGDAGSLFGALLEELCGLAYSQPKNVPPNALTEPIRDFCRTRIESSLAALTTKAEGLRILCNAVASIDHGTRAMSEEIKAAVEKALSRMRKLLKRHAKSDDGKNLMQALAALYAVAIFQLYNEDPDAMEILNDLDDFYEKLRANKTGDKNEGSSELLVEILLSMVARQSSLMRQISQQVFRAFTSQISADGLMLLTGPLASDESAKGQKELFSTEDDEAVDGSDESGDDDDDDDSVEVLTDVEMDDDVELAKLGEGEDEGEASGDDAEGEEEEQSGELDGSQDLDDAVGKILNSHRLDKDMEADDSSSDGNMSDSAMFALDDKLAEVFKQRAKARPDSKKQKKKAKESVVNFKHRILDLVDIYVKQEASNFRTLSLLVPLLQLMRSTSTKALAQRACEITVNYQKALRKERSGQGAQDGPKEEDLLELLAEVHREAGMGVSQAYARAASAASLIVASTLVGGRREAVKRVAAVYGETQSDWVLGEAQLRNSFFADWNNWCQNLASQARG